MKLLVILLSIMTYCWVESLDPEEELCQEKTIDAAVNADDEIDYIFRGDSYWTINWETGVPPENGKWITDRWPGLPTPIDAAFTIDDVKHKLSTVFIIGKEWYLYKGSEQVATGFTDNWLSFPNYKILGALDFNDKVHYPERKDYYIYFLFKPEQVMMYAAYQFQDGVENPKYNQTYRATIYYVLPTNSRPHLVWFWYGAIDDPSQFTDTMESYIDVTAALANKEKVIFFGPGTYCWAEYPDKPITMPMPLCYKHIGNNVTQYYGCPRSPRITQKPTTTLKPTTDKPITDQPITDKPITDNLITDNLMTDNPLTGSKVYTNDLGGGVSSTKFIDTVFTSTPAIKSGAHGSRHTPSGDKPKGGTNWTLICAIISIIIIVCVVVFVTIFIITIKKEDKSAQNNNKKTDISKRKATPSDSKKPQTQSTEVTEGDQLIQDMKSKDLDE